MQTDGTTRIDNAGNGALNSLIVEPNTNVVSTFIYQTSAASPTTDIFDITNSSGATKYLYVDVNGNVNIKNLVVQQLNAEAANVNTLLDTTTLTVGGIYQEAIYAKSVTDTGALTVGGASTLQQVNAEGVYVKSLSDTGALTVGGTSTLQQVNSEANYVKSLYDTTNLTVGGNSMQEAIYAKSIADTGALTVGGDVNLAASEFRGELCKEPLPPTRRI